MSGSEEGRTEKTMSSAKSAFEQFLDTPENKRLYEQERLLVDVTELLTAVMDKRRINRAQLAQRLGKSKAFVTQVLRGRHNMTLRTLADLFGAMECRVDLQVSPMAGRSTEGQMWSLGNRWLWCDASQVVDSVWQVWWQHSLERGTVEANSAKTYSQPPENVEAA
jgi:antitoxin component HigA of HigAB toxin-antitoxin module